MEVIFMKMTKRSVIKKVASVFKCLSKPGFAFKVVTAYPVKSDGSDWNAIGTVQKPAGVQEPTQRDMIDHDKAKVLEEKNVVAFYPESKYHVVARLDLGGKTVVAAFGKEWADLPSGDRWLTSSDV